MNLPFLKSRRLPTRRKLVGESRYGFSEDDELIEDALEELISAMDRKDSKALVAALMALIEVISNKEPGDADDAPEVP